MLRRVAHPTDRRATLLELTGTGCAAAGDSLGPRVAEISTLFDELSPTRPHGVPQRPAYAGGGDGAGRRPALTAASPHPRTPAGTVTETEIVRSRQWPAWSQYGASVVTADELVGFREGHPDAVRSVYREYGGLVFAVAMRTLGSRDLAEEATQRTFVKAWRASGGFDPVRELGPWLATIARRTAIDIHRREARRPTAPLEESQPSDPTVIELPVGVERSFEVGEVRAAIDELPAEEREVVRLQHLEELTQAEVADRLGVPIGTVKSRSFRAHRRLAAMLGHLREATG